MGRAIARCIVCLVPVAVLVAASAASAALLVDFENDPAGFNLLNDFESDDSPLIHFSDIYDGNRLMVLDFDGSHALGVLSDDGNGLLMEFDFVASALSLEIGGNTPETSHVSMNIFLGLGPLAPGTALLINSRGYDARVFSVYIASSRSRCRKRVSKTTFSRIVPNICVTA
jgi:hypothetical protein